MSEPILKGFPGARYYPEERLLSWHPRGILGEELANRVVEFIETEEKFAEVPFNRYTDFSGLTEIRLKVGHAFQIAERRRTGYAGADPVRSAFYADTIVGFGVARLYETLMEGGPILVRAFRSRGEAAEWLGVRSEILLPKKIGGASASKRPRGGGDGSS